MFTIDERFSTETRRDGPTKIASTKPVLKIQAKL